MQEKSRTFWKDADPALPEVADARGPFCYESEGRRLEPDHLHRRVPYPDVGSDFYFPGLYTIVIEVLASGMKS